MSVPPPKTQPETIVKSDHLLRLFNSTEAIIPIQKCIYWNNSTTRDIKEHGSSFKDTTLTVTRLFHTLPLEQIKLILKIEKY